MVKPFGLSKKQKLKSRKAIERLFETKQRFTIYPLQTWWKLVDSQEKAGVQVGVSCSKRQFKKAVDRNRVKRLLRESYRLQQADILALLQEKGKSLQVFFIYIGADMPDFAQAYTLVSKSLAELEKKI
jgi:ribonuclease P protein component